MESKYNTVWIAGDPIEDIWSYGHRDSRNRWNPQHSEIRHGGAANTHANFVSIAKGLPVYGNAQMKSEAPELIRLVTKNGLDTEIWNYHGDITKSCKIPGNIMKIRPGANYPIGFLISEYNKGSCNRPTKRVLPNFEFAVVDSRYRTLDMSWLQTTKTKIWHATGSEYKEEWARNFDYVLWTNGPQPVNVSGGINEFGYRTHTHLDVPNTTVTDTVGAGDTFTAAVGVYLSWWLRTNSYAELHIDTVTEAAEFAIWCCQDVITQQHTAVCRRTLKEYLGA